MTKMLNRPTENIGTDFYLKCHLDLFGKFSLIWTLLKYYKQILYNPFVSVAALLPTPLEDFPCILERQMTGDHKFSPVMSVTSCVLRSSHEDTEGDTLHSNVFRQLTISLLQVMDYVVPTSGDVGKEPCKQ